MEEWNQYIEQVAQALGGWEVVNSETYSGGAQIALLRSTDGIGISLRRGGWAAKGRVQIEGDTEGLGGFLPFRQPVPSINVSPTKAPEQVAKDIQRRLLPAWEPLLRDLWQQKTKRDAHWLAVLELANRLEQVLQTEAELEVSRTDEPDQQRVILRAYPQQPDDHFHYLDVKVAKETVTCHLHDLTPSLAERVLRLVMEAIPHKRKG